MVPQADLEQYIYLTNQTRRLRRKRADLGKSIMARLAAGAEIEKGPHVAEIREKDKGDRVLRKLKVR